MNESNGTGNGNVQARREAEKPGNGSAGVARDALAIQQWLVDWLAGRLEISASEINVREPFASYGLGSVQAVEVMADLEAWLGLRLSPTLAWEYPDVESLARYLADGARSTQVESSIGMRRLDGASEPVAIIGLACRFPGATGIPAYWHLLTNGVDAIREVPPERWDIDAYYDADPAVPNKMITRNGGFIDEIDLFDAAFFGISPREAANMDPQQRLLMQTVWEALEDAGQNVDALAGHPVGVFIGMSHNDYGRMQMNPAFCDPHMLTGNAGSIAANRISYRYNFRGPSLTLDTACSSTLVATHFACRSIASGESSMAVVGGACVMLSPTISVNFSKAGMLSPDGHCKAFDASANGFARGEGAAAMILKPLAKALQDGDPIYAVVRGSAVNSDGRTNGITAPSREAQEAVIREACAVAGVSPHEISYVEAHGTGTPLGDPIEVKALGNVLSIGRAEGDACLLGSAKTNIGHLESVSGIAGLAKVALSLKHRTIPPSLHFNKPNPHIPFDELPLRVQTELTPWPEHVDRAIAGINSFGFGGTNAHVILEESPSASFDADQPPLVRRPYIMVASARNPEALEALAAAYGTALRDTDESGNDVRDACYTACVRRTHHEHRLAVIGRTRDELADHFDAFTRQERGPGIATGVAAADRVPKTAFVFPGQGSQWWGMGRQLLEQEPVFRVTVDRCDDLLRPLAGWSIKEMLTADESASRLDDTEFAQPAVFCLQVGLAALWRSWGIVPDAVIGHSMGEVAAAHVAGVLSFEDAVTVIFHRGRLMQQATGKGRMAAVAMSVADAQDLLKPFDGRVSIAAENGPESLTLSGAPDAVAQVLQVLDERQVFHRMLAVNYAFHSSQMADIAKEIEAVLGEIQPREARLPIYSTLTGAALYGSQFNAEYWGRNVAQPVQFLRALDGLLDDGHQFFVEIGAQPTVAGDVRRRLRERAIDGWSTSSLARETDDQVSLLNVLATLYTAGYPVDWRRLYPEPRRCVALPSYPWQRKRFWVDHTEDAIWDGAWRGPGKNTEHPLISKLADGAHPSVDAVLSVQKLPYLNDHRVQGAVTVPAAAFVEIALAAANADGRHAAAVEDLSIAKPLFLRDDSAERVQLIMTPESEGRSALHLYSTGMDRSRSDQEWKLHVTGRVTFSADGNGQLHAPAEAPESIQARCNREKDADRFYATLQKVGLDYGPQFRGVDYIWANDEEAIARIHVPQALQSDLQKYHLHPAVLDACLQSLAPLIPGAEEAGSLYVPINIGKVRVHRPLSTEFWCHVRLTDYDYDTGLMVEGDFTLFDDDCNVVAELSALRAQRLDSESYGIDRDGHAGEWLYEIAWEPKDRPGEYRVPTPPDFIPANAVLAAKAEAAVVRLGKRYAFDQYCKDAAFFNAEMCRDFIVDALRKLGWAFPVGESFSAEALAAQLNIAPHYHGLFARLMEILAARGILEGAAGQWTVLESPDPGDPVERCKQLIQQIPVLSAEGTLLGRCGERLAEVLTGQCDPRPLLFPDGSMADLERIYQEAAFARVYNGALLEALQSALESLPTGRRVRILELGAGTGSTTSYLLSKLPANRVDYVFTDVTGLFLVYAEQKFAAYPWVSYKTLDIERDPIEQGFQPHEFDIIIAANVIHATADLRNALRNARGLLNENGLLMLVESTAPAETFDLIFGLLDELWRFQDHDVRPHYMLIDPDRWCRLLEEVGFNVARAVPEDPRITRDPTRQTLILARGPKIDAPESFSTQPELAPYSNPGNWIVFGRDDALSQELCDRLSRQGESCIIAYPGDAFADLGSDRYTVRPACAEDIQSLIAAATMDPAKPVRGVVHLWSASGMDEIPSLDDIADAQSISILTLREVVRAITAAELEPSPRLWVVTRGAQDVAGTEKSVDLCAAPLWGMSRALVVEQLALWPSNVDLPPQPRSGEAEWLVREFWAQSHEDQVALRDAQRYVKRIVAEADGSRIVTDDKPIAADADSPFALSVDTPGMIESVCLRATSRKDPGPGEVEVKVAAAGVNFRDVMKTLGIYPMAPGEPFWLGDECAGTVLRVGDGVTTIKPGDRVMAIGPDSFSSYVTQPAETVFPMPESLSFEQAAGLPTVFLTAYYALHEIAHIQPGERVLIHAAAGGVGMAAIQLAKRIGAEVFATAGSNEKRETIRALGVDHVMDSRNLDFAGAIMRQTHGEGVDVVLNSLAGEAITKSLGTLRHGGRFIEIGKRDIFENSRIGLAAFKNNQSFHAVDLAQVFRARPALARQMMDAIVGLVQSGGLQPLPVQCFQAAEAADAFRHMAQAKHIGKVVLSFDESEVPVKPANEHTLALSPDATYLVTGGLGGFGLAVAQWLADKGARHLALVGRSGAVRPEATLALTQFEEQGIDAVVLKADVADRAQLESVLQSIQTTMPPLRGIVHSAMVLDDVPFVDMIDERFWNVFRPKVDGAWNLHTLTQDLDLDFFVLFSSASSVVGGPGQVNYGSANEFLSMLAHYRRSRGLAAVALNLGRIGDVGYVHEHEKVGELLDRYGIQAMPIKPTLDLLERILIKEPVQLGLMKMDWDLLRTLHPGGMEYPLLARLKSGAGRGATRTHGGLSQAEVLALPEDQRLPRLEAHIQSEIAEVLQMDPAAVNLSVPLNELGLDSLVGIELRARLETDLQIKMPMTLLMQGPSIKDLAAYFLKELTSAATESAGAVREVIEIDAETDAKSPDEPADQAEDMEREVVEL